MAALVASEQVRTQRLPLTLIFTADEEVGCVGAKHAAEDAALRPSHAIVGEPTSLTPIRAHKGYCAVEVVLTDLAMPELGGQDLAQRLSALRPGLPVIFMSGYTDDDLIRRGLLDAGIPYLEKPFSPDALTRIIRTVLPRRG